jgi:Calx-beta domain/FG-GAP-like repeat/RTX calcium-binding nonapeptide repeat (4 copies)
MTTNLPRQDAAPVAVSGAVGSTVSLYDLLVQSYGENISQIQSVFVGVNAASGQNWDGSNASALTQTGVVDASNNDAPISGNINADEFKNVMIKIGNNINDNVFVTVPESSGNGPFVGRTLSITTLPSQLDEHVPAGHVPTAADIVASARMFATVGVEGNVANSDDCHGIATAIAAAAGATFDPNTGNTTDIGANPNEPGGFWRIAATGAAVGANWESQVQAGDIVRFQHNDLDAQGHVIGTDQHTITVVSALQTTGAHAGQIEVVDNSDSVISDHWVDAQTAAQVIPGTVTIYRLTTDGLYLTDQSSETTNDNILGTTFNDLIKAGSGNDTLTGGAGNDTLDGGAGDNTAVFSGKESDYKITVTGGTTTIADLRAGAPDGTDTLTNIQHVKFSDVTVNTSDLKSTPVTPPPPPSVSINNVSVVEGNDGSIAHEIFTVTRTGGSGAFNVNYTTADGSATTKDNDYQAQSGVLQFAQGELSKTISVAVVGDAKVEANETFDVNLSGATNGATITQAQGVGTIVNDDVAPPPPPSVSINNVSVVEGNNGGIAHEIFTVTRTGGSGAFNVNYTTADGSATTKDNDYQAQSGVLQFAQGELSKTISVAVVGDAKVEANETFDVNLSGATNGATITQAQGVGTIVNDDVAPPPPPSVSINNVSVVEGNNGGIAHEIFTVTRTGGEGAFDVNYTTADGTATTKDDDYQFQANTLHFAAGVDSETISVAVVGDSKVEANETFDVNLSGATNGATITQAQGVGTIVNDDVATTTPVTHHADNDFNGDGISDVLFGNNSGTLALWEMNGDKITSNTTVGSVAAGWHVDGSADFNGDGMSDILLHSDTGQVAVWQMNGDHVVSSTTIGSVSTDWHEAATGDFNGDGKADILWQNANGQVAMWEMDGNKIVSNTAVGSMSTDSHVIGTGDFNGDGKTDILWENSKGQVTMWEMDGNKVVSSAVVGSVSSDWHAAGVADFNGDGKADILWQNANGQVAMWQMNGEHIASNTTVGSAAGLTVIGTGDYNHDGKADVLLQNASGAVTEWQMNGDHIADNHAVGSHSVDWHMV